MEKSYPAFIFLFETLPKIDPIFLSNSIEAIEPLQKPVSVDIQVQEENILHAIVEFDRHKLKLVGFSSPAPTALTEKTIQPSNWKQEDKISLNNHQAHIICFYEGFVDEATEQFIAMYKTAYSFCDRGLLGILDEEAWNCMPLRMVQEQIKPEMLDACREAVPLGIWTGFVKFFKNNNDVWFCTKGYHRFGVNDFAYLGKLEEAEFVYELFGNLFSYIRDSQAEFKIGHTAQVGENEFIRFREIYEYEDFLDSPLTTMAIEKISASEINRS